MKEKKLYKEIGLVDEDLIEEAEHVEAKKPCNKAFIRFGAVAACLAILAVIGIPLLMKGKKAEDPTTQITLSGGVIGKYVDEVPDEKVSYDLADLSLEEIFNKWGKVIVQGTVIKIKNIQLEFKDSKSYRALATIKVDKVYKGEAKEGDTITVLLPCGINDGTWTEDCGVISCIRKGMQGIFMPMIYDDSAYEEMNGVTLHLKELAEYGLGDGERFAFLATDEGLVYDAYTYPEVKKTDSLEQVGTYIEGLLKKYKSK